MKLHSLFIVGLFTACFASQALAGWKVSTAATFCGTAAQVAAAYKAAADGSVGGYTYVNTVVSVNETTGALSGTYVSTNNATGGTGTGTWTFQSVACTANSCNAKSGKPSITNFTVGYTRTDGLGSNSDDYACVGACNQIPVSRQICDGGCVVDLGDANAAWRSTEPTANGLFRLSIDMVSVPTGATCTPSAADAPASPSTPAPPCPGYVGEINGKKGCYGTAQTPITTTPADRAAQGAQPGNPAAGEKPSTGEGSGSTGAGRTPATGTGGPSGGPASAAIGPSGRVTTPPTGEEQAQCGAPGQPRCAIDETGTPTGKGVLPTTDFNNKLKELEDALPGVVNPAGKDTTWGVMPQWTQSGACSPWHMFTLPPFLGSFSVDIDVCPVKPFADGMANFIWISLAFMGITAMVFNTMTSKAN